MCNNFLLILDINIITFFSIIKQIFSNELCILIVSKKLFIKFNIRVFCLCGIFVSPSTLCKPSINVSKYILFGFTGAISIFVLTVLILFVSFGSIEIILMVIEPILVSDLEAIIYMAIKVIIM